MNVNGTRYTSLWYEAATGKVFYIDQTRLPADLIILEMKTFQDGVRAIREMEVRGAPLIGVAAAFAMVVGFRDWITGAGNDTGGHPAQDEHEILRWMADELIRTRPTAVNLAWAVNVMLDTSPSRVAGHRSPVTRNATLLSTALQIRDYELQNSRLIAENGLPILEEVARRKNGRPVNILTHCNAGWLAAVDYGTALAPLYLAHDRGIPVHVWVDETRPRNQGARLTAWELSAHGIPNTLIVDNAGGLLMQQGRVDLVITGADRITANGDVVNKIGTYLKALAARDNGVPFYVAAPASTFDFQTASGSDVVIEERSEDEVSLDGMGNRTIPERTRVHNPGFDITPAHLVSDYLTEKGIGFPMHPEPPVIPA